MLLSEKYRQLADSYNNAGFAEQRKLIEATIEQAAARGQTTVNFYPKEYNFKTQIMAWLEDEGFIAEWESYQRDGTWIRISW